MPKRECGDKIRFYESKIRKLREESKCKRRKRIIYSDSSSSENSDDETLPTVLTNPLNEELDSEPPPEPTSEVPVQEVDAASVSDIDADFLSALGEAAKDKPVYGDKIHDTLAQRWLPILKQGIPKDAKESLLNEQKIPENCKLLRAPVLNPEISAAISENIRFRDKRIETLQQNLGLGITAVNRAMDLLLSGDDKQSKVKAIKSLSEACRILSDLHYMETKARIKYLKPVLDKSFLTMLQDVERDEFLFGNKLADKIKASKAIEKQGQQIKKAVTQQKTPNQSTSQPANQTRYQGNWSAPPRYHPSSNRGGRGGAQRTPTATRKPSNFTTQMPAATTRGSYNKQRAPPRQ